MDDTDTPALPELPRRVAVIGVCGAGKSTLSPALAALLGLPLVHLDQEYWLPGWTEPDKAAWRERHAELITRERWVLDGITAARSVSGVVRADLVILLVVPSSVALWRVIRRAIRTRGVARPDMALGCVERPLRRGSLAFWWYVARFNAKRMPAIRQTLEELAAGRTIEVSSAADRDRLLQRFASGS